MASNFEFYSPTRVIFGKGTEQRVGALVREYGGTRVLIVYGGIKLDWDMAETASVFLALADIEGVLGGFGPSAISKEILESCKKMLGAAFKELPDDLKKQLNLGYGLQVTGVTSGKMADAGVRKGFIILKANDQPMRKVSDLEEVMKAAVKSPNQVLFLTGVFPSGKRGYYAVDLTQE